MTIENVIGKSNGSMCSDNKRERCTCAMVDNM